MFSCIVRQGKKGPKATEEDVRALVSLTRWSGVLKPYEGMAICNILSLDSRGVDQIMPPRTMVFPCLETSP